jgi:hypothetical protein
LKALDGAGDCDDDCGRRPESSGRREDAMAKGEQRGNKEAKKPKSDKPKTHESAYKKSLKGAPSLSVSGKKG